MRVDTRKLRLIGLLGSAVLYGISLFCPAFQFAEGHSSFLVGFVCLLFGWGYLPWYANLSYFASLLALLLKRSAWAALLAAAAFALGLTTLQITEVPRNEGGDMTAVVGFGLGFYLWMISMLTVVVFGAGAALKQRKEAATEPPQLS